MGRDMERRRAYMKKYQKTWVSLNRDKHNARGRRWRKNNPDKVKKITRKVFLRSKYDLTPEQFEEMKKAQGGVCALCKQSPKDKRGLFVDHNHRTGKVRALLCTGCNWAVGMYEKFGIINIWAYLSRYDD